MLPIAVVLAAASIAVAPECVSPSVPGNIKLLRAIGDLTLLEYRIQAELEASAGPERFFWSVRHRVKVRVGAGGGRIEVADSFESEGDLARDSERTGRRAIACLSARVGHERRIARRTPIGYVLDLSQKDADVEVAYRMAASRDFDIIALAVMVAPGDDVRGFAAPIETEFLGLGDWPATHVRVEASDWARRAEWRYGRGIFRSVLRPAPGAVMSLWFPDGRCGAASCSAEAQTGYCETGGACGLCAGTYYEEGVFKAWMEAAKGGHYDERSLALARNWIFARHGTRFRIGWLRAYFRAQRWYCPTDWPTPLTVREEEVVRAVKLMEAEVQPPARVDGGVSPVRGKF